MNTIETKLARLSIIHEDGVWYAEIQLELPYSEEPVIVRGTFDPNEDLLTFAEYVISEKRKTQQ